MPEPVEFPNNAHVGAIASLEIDVAVEVESAIRIRKVDRGASQRSGAARDRAKATSVRSIIRSALAISAAVSSGKSVRCEAASDWGGKLNPEKK